VSALSRPIRVLHLRDSPWIDGPGRTILETARHIDTGRVEYHIGAFVSDASAPHPLVEKANLLSLRVHAISDHGGLGTELVDRIVRLLDEHRIDILHTSEFRSSVLALLCRRRRPVTLVTTAHGWIANDLRGRIYRIADKIFLRLFDRVIFVSQAMRRLVPAWWLGRRSRVLLNALVLEEYGKDVLNEVRRAPDPRHKAVLLNVGRLSPEKGQDLLLRAIAVLATEFPGIRLQFAGIGPLESELRHLAASLGIADRVEFLGYIKDMPRLFSQCDLVVQSSLTEGLPNVILEAAYLRVPIVATAVGGTDEVVEHARSAWLIQPGRLDELIAGLREYLRRPAEFVAMAELAHGGVRDNFSFRIRTERLMTLYEELLGKAS
jgi:glycosyltransferase involved in cell wall biosynthesis